MPKVIRWIQLSGVESQTHIVSISLQSYQDTLGKD